MVTPTWTGAYSSVSSYTNGYITGYRRKQKYGQTKPYNLVLPYDSYNGRAWLSNYGSYLGSPFENAQTVCTSNYDAGLMDNACIQAYERLKGRVYDQAQLGVDFAEYRQSLGMIAHSASTLWRFTRHVRRFEFAAAAHTLRMKFHPPGVKARRAWSNNWLEYHFGWEPLVKDIHEALTVLNNPIKNFTVQKGRGLEYKRINLNDTPAGAASWRKRVYDTYYLAQQGAQVSALTNRGLHALDQFGLANPAVILWELIPFSFVVDWFANVGNVLASFSDFAGMTLGYQYTSRKFICVHGGQTYYAPTYNGPRDLPPLTMGAFGVHFWRSSGLTSPNFSVKKLRLPSSTRAVTAVALLNQIFH